MLRAILAIVFAIALAALPASAQQQMPQPPATQPEASLVGLPIMSSDGERIGQVSAVEDDNGQVVLIGEIDRPLGIGPAEVAILASIFVERGDHIELTLTAEEVRDAIARAQQ